MGLHSKATSFQIRKEEPKAGQFLANYADAEALYDHYGSQPWTDITDRTVQRIASAFPSISRQQTILGNFLQGTGRTMSVDTPTVRWKLGGTNRVSFRLLENVAETLTAPGVHFSEFPIKLNTDLFVPGDKIAPELDRMCVLAIQSEGLPDGDGWIYQVQVVTDDPNEYFPTEYLEENLRYIKAGSSGFSEGSSDWGSALIEYGMSWAEFEVQLHKTGKQFTFTDEALATMINVEPKNKMGEVIRGARKVTTLAELQFDAEIRWEKEQDLVWGRQSRSVTDETTGLHRRYGAGLFEFMKDGNTFYYNPGNSSIRMIVDFLESVWYDRVGPNNANVVFYTGKPGLELFDKWVRAEYGEQAVIRDSKDYLERIGNVIPGGVEAFKFKNPQFKAYELPTYGVIRVEHWPILDSTWLNGPKHPKTGKPLSAYNFVCLNYGLGMGGGSNIVLVNRSNMKYYHYEAGAVSPGGPINSRNGGGRYQAVHSGRYATLRHGDEYGILVKDILLTAWVKPNIQ